MSFHRYTINSSESLGTGYLNIQLTPNEWSELKGVDGEACTFGNPCYARGVDGKLKGSNDEGRQFWAQRNNTQVTFINFGNYTNCHRQPKQSSLVPRCAVSHCKPGVGNVTLSGMSFHTAYFFRSVISSYDEYLSSNSKTRQIFARSVCLFSSRNLSFF